MKNIKIGSLVVLSGYGYGIVLDANPRTFASRHGYYKCFFIGIGIDYFPLFVKSWYEVLWEPNK